MSTDLPILEPGKQYVTLSGDLVIFLGDVADGHVVRSVVEVGCSECDCDVVEGETYVTTGALYKEPPKTKKHEEIAALQSRVASLLNDEKTARETLSKLRSEIRRAEDDNQDLLRRLRANDQLTFIEEFLNGDILKRPCVIDKWSGPEISTVAEVLDDKENDRYYNTSRAHGLKLLTLFGKSDGNLSWGVNQYRDGSGSNMTMHVFETVEAAQEYVFDTKISAIEENANRPATDGSRRINAFDLWDKIGRPPVSETARQNMLEANAQRLRDRYDKKRLEAGKIDAELLAIMAQMRGTIYGGNTGDNGERSPQN